MKKSIVGELYFKAFQSGNPSHTFIAINVLAFLVMSIFFIVDRFSGSSVGGVLTTYLAMPSSADLFLYRPWTWFTNMFLHIEIFHLIFNMLWLYWMGNIFLDFLNNRQFIFTYISGGLLGGLFFIILYNLVPAFSNGNALLLGASGCIYAIVVATATLVPDYTIRLLFFGNVRLKWLAIVFVVLSLIGLGGSNVGGNIAHLAGALFGFVFIKQLRNGKDWSKVLKRKKNKLKVIINERHNVKKEKVTFSNQEYIDSILDKISKSGYSSLSKEEKDALFKASKQD